MGICNSRDSRLLSITKLQNLKAIHNSVFKLILFVLVVINHKTTKFESNSQLEAVANESLLSCYQSQNYKIWKQFTTILCCLCLFSLLLSIAKLQNLKAIHNEEGQLDAYLNVVINRKTTKFESNSQPLAGCSYYAKVVINRKTTKFESNSQLILCIQVLSVCCYQSQNYKIWKQFTTNGRARKVLRKVVINRKTTKFESNSQPSAQ